jgi:hypothetical protein
MTLLPLDIIHYSLHIDIITPLAIVIAITTYWHYYYYFSLHFIIINIDYIYQMLFIISH